MMSVPMENVLPQRRVTVGEYYHMADCGLFAPETRVELIEGAITGMPPIGPRHAAAVECLRERLSEAARHLVQVRAGQPVRLDEASEPQPDISVVRIQPDYYSEAHPSAEDVCLLVEVSDTTFRFDRDSKVPLYARHGVPEVWLFELPRNQLHVLRSPARGAYRQACTLVPPCIATLARLPGIRVAIGRS